MRPSSSSRRAPAGPGGKLSIGALSRATGIPIETLRTWEHRYGFPVPERKPSGHRVYALSSVPRLRRIAEALARGHRAGQVVPASDQDLAALLQATPGVGSQSRPSPVAGPAEVSDLLAAVQSFDADRLTGLLLRDWARLGPLEFLTSRIAPAVRAVGDAWESKRLEICHEHFFSERLADVLRSLRLPFEERARGPLLVLASLPGESHALGLQMAALLLAVAGCRILFLGTEVPESQIASLARDLKARAVAVSISSATRGPESEERLRQLRELLSRRVALVVGGDGAPSSGPGLEVIQGLAGLDDWARRLVGSQPVPSDD